MVDNNTLDNGYIHSYVIDFELALRVFNSSKNTLNSFNSMNSTIFVRIRRRVDTRHIDNDGLRTPY